MRLIPKEDITDTGLKGPRVKKMDGKSTTELRLSRGKVKILANVAKKIIDIYVEYQNFGDKSMINAENLISKITTIYLQYTLTFQTLEVPLLSWFKKKPKNCSFKISIMDIMSSEISANISNLCREVRKKR